MGATGRTGNLVLEEALKKGYEVSCLVRDSGKVHRKKGLTIFEGLPSNPLDLKKAMEGCTTIINVLNISRKSDFPWAPLRTAKNLISDTIAQVIALSNERGLKRLISCSAWGVHETKDHIPFWFRWLIASSNIGVAYKDHERQEQVLEQSKTQWTIVRPVGLTNSKKQGTIRESFNNSPKPNLTISRKAVAEYLVNCIEREDLIHKRVVISKD